jgi:hypothetical protein
VLLGPLRGYLSMTSLEVNVRAFEALLARAVTVKAGRAI